MEAGTTWGRLSACFNTAQPLPALFPFCASSAGAGRLSSDLSEGCLLGTDHGRGSHLVSLYLLSIRRLSELASSLH